MKPSEMSNKELAKNIEYTADELPNYGGFECADELYEAAKRLRNVTVRSDNSAVIAKLQCLLKVAEDALELTKNAMCDYCHSTLEEAKGLPCSKGCKTFAIAEHALATIRKKKGENQ